MLALSMLWPVFVYACKPTLSGDMLIMTTSLVCCTSVVWCGLKPQLVDQVTCSSVGASGPQQAIDMLQAGLRDNHNRYAHILKRQTGCPCTLEQSS